MIEGGRRALVFQGQISWNASLTDTPENALWTKMRFTASGAGDESKLLTGAALYIDSNQNGSLDPGDEQIGQSVGISSDNGAVEFSFSEELSANSTRSFFLVADLASPAATSSALFFPVLIVGGGLLWRSRRRKAQTPVSSGQAVSFLPLLGITILFCLPLGIAACGGGGGGGRHGGPPPAVSREIRFGILSPSDIGLQGKLTGVSGTVQGLPVQGAPLDV